ncbi:hypothetical protein SAMN05421774_105315 [Gemmobacter megaterium]|uniref:Uncharacterized protein n=1 Tax=Gemmobacter megaterium TaxID=1086013 RepID=A0A1N7PJX0_9RHOB|nr:hypothetical protein [Gemmobacter megaterium]GGE17840.1 hypothetical protein GCM10011345_24550 [Gemmobacter megaterium]SIT10807.1 hypothetical protein SAMN05421774_105315 [Gemmobacter megaterium]
MTDFSAQSVQFAWFVVDTSTMMADTLMKGILALDADTVQSNRVPSPQMPFLSSATRVEGKLKYTLNVSPGRVDLFIQPAADPTDGLFPMMDAQHAFASVIGGLERKGSLSLPNVYRFAVVCAFLDAAAGLEDANVAFFKKVGLPYLAGATDQDFSLNLRKSIDEPRVEMNRLVRYSVDLVQQLEMIAPASGFANLSNSRLIRELYFLRSTIDVNNVPTNSVFFDGCQVLAMAKAFTEEAANLHRMRNIGELA